MVLGELLERVYRGIHSDIVDGVATAGSNQNTIVDTALAGKFTANKFRNWVAFVSRTTDGAAPQSQYATISSYATSTTDGTATLSTSLSATIDAGDEYSFCKPDIPLYTLVKLCNDGLKALGRIQLVDTSLTLDASTIRYNLPMALKGKKPSLVYFRHPTTNVRAHAPNWEIEPAASGQPAVLVFKKQSVALNSTNVFQTYDGWKIVIHYEGIHQTLTAYNSPVNELIHDELAVAACVERSLYWKTQPRQRKIDVANWQMAKMMLESAKRNYPIEQPIRDQQRVPIGLFNWRR